MGSSPSTKALPEECDIESLAGEFAKKVCLGAVKQYHNLKRFEENSPYANCHVSIKAFLLQLESMPSRKIFSKAYGRLWASNDLEDYRAGYPGKDLNNKKLSSNLNFYLNKIKSKPSGGFIDDIHKEWFGQYDLLEYHHGYIQWLFPIHEHGMNSDSQVLQRHEAEAMRKDPIIIERILKSYELMLDFYGFTLDRSTRELSRAPHYKDRFYNLNTHGHNYLRITRILKCLGEMGLEEYKAPFLVKFLEEIVLNGELQNVRGSIGDYWVPTLKNETDRAALMSVISKFSQDSSEEPEMNKKGGKKGKKY